MSPVVTIGNLAIGLALASSLFGLVLLAAARQTGSASAGWWGRGTLYANFALLTAANLAMIYALLGNDFGVSYVAHVGSRETPRWVSAISLWSSLEGSILLWGWVLTGFSAVFTYVTNEPSRRIVASSLIVLLAVQMFFFLLLALPANPFLPVSPPPANGPGPNPLLQNHWLMAVHPPCLYLGYIGFTVPFALAIAALWETALPEDWTALLRRWSLFAWSFLSMAIVLGGWWSYAVLGWGGYWAWDPVENASFMPWLAGTALIHSLMVQERRKMLAGWNLTLACLTFLLTIVGTFLTRSGVLESVHSFTESAIGPYFLVFIGLLLAVTAGLLLWRAPRLRTPGRIDSLFSLEVLFLFNNLLFLSFCFVVFVGTFYPLIVEAVRGDRISVGEPYFNQMAVPMTAMIVLLMGIALKVPWRRGRPRDFLMQARRPAAFAAASVLAGAVLGARDPWVVSLLFLSGFAFFVMAIEFARGVRKDPRRWGGYLAHVGALMIVVGVALSSVYEREREVTLAPGGAETVGDYTLALADVTAVESPQRYEVGAEIEVSKGGRPLTWLTPRMNYYPNSREPIGSPAVRSTLLGDLYLTLINVGEDGSQVSLRVIQAPAVAWIWIGGLVVLLGGLAATFLGGRKK